MREMRRWPTEEKKTRLQSQKGNIKVNIVKILSEIYVSCLLSDNPNVPGDSHADTIPRATENKFRNMQTLEFTIMNITLLVAFGIVAHSVVCPTLWTITLCVFAHLANGRTTGNRIILTTQQHSLFLIHNTHIPFRPFPLRTPVQRHDRRRRGRSADKTPTKIPFMQPAVVNDAVARSTWTRFFFHFGKYRREDTELFRWANAQENECAKWFVLLFPCGLTRSRDDVRERKRCHVTCHVALRRQIEPQRARCLESTGDWCSRCQCIE